MSDLAETIARLRVDVAHAHPDDNIPVSWRSLRAVLDAAEAGMTARDAALEEAAAIADKYGDGSGPETAVGRRCYEIGNAIRAFKGAA